MIEGRKNLWLERIMVRGTVVVKLRALRLCPKCNRGGAPAFERVPSPADIAPEGSSGRLFEEGVGLSLGSNAGADTMARMDHRGIG